MTQRIGIVACSAEGASLCYRTICAEGAGPLGPHAHPEVSMHTPPLSDYMACIDRNDWAGVGELMLASAEKLAMIVCPDNTIHQALHFVRDRSPRPWLHIAEEVAREAQARGFRRVGLTGTRWLVRSDVYPRRLQAQGIDFERPAEADQETMNRIIMEELVYGRFLPESVAWFENLIARFEDADPRFR